MRLAVLLSIAASADAHGALVSPPPRNAVDKDLAPWNGPVPSHPPSVESATGWCPVPDKNGRPSGQNGQACFWFSNGCAIGCKECDGSSRGPIPWGRFKGDPFWDRKFNLCPIGAANSTQKAGTATATICDPKLRTVNTAVACGAKDDWYYYSPWRAPGAAPVFDSCGMAAGHPPPVPKLNFGGLYVNTSHAKVGDRGSKVLPKAPSGTVWSAGTSYEVSWTIEANHGGGYSYRLAPASSPLTEATFRKLPLKFVGQQMLRWGGGTANGGKQLSFNATYATTGTTPPGSMWAKNPIPRNDGVTGQGYSLAPGCEALWGANATKMCSGMGDGSSAVPNLEIVDRVLIPKDTPPGEYVLGWRWDCEESNQIWQSCADITVKA